MSNFIDTFWLLCGIALVLLFLGWAVVLFLLFWPISKED